MRESVCVCVYVPLCLGSGMGGMGRDGPLFGVRMRGICMLVRVRAAAAAGIHVRVCTLHFLFPLIRECNNVSGR
jgi:hypothetical protein